MDGAVISLLAFAGAALVFASACWLQCHKNHPCVSRICAYHCCRRESRLDTFMCAVDHFLLACGCVCLYAYACVWMCTAARKATDCSSL